MGNEVMTFEANASRALAELAKLQAAEKALAKEMRDAAMEAVKGSEVAQKALIDHAEATQGLKGRIDELKTSIKATNAEMNASPLDKLNAEHNKLMATIQQHALAAVRGGEAEKQALMATGAQLQALQKEMLQMQQIQHAATHQGSGFAAMMSRNQMAVTQVMFALDDFNTVASMQSYTMKGMAAGVMGAANNFSALLAPINPLLVLVPSLAAAGLKLAASYYDSGESAKKAAESLKIYEDRIKSLQDELAKLQGKEKELADERDQQVKIHAQMAAGKDVADAQAEVRAADERLGRLRSMHNDAVAVSDETWVSAQSQRDTAQGKLLEAKYRQQQLADAEAKRAYMVRANKAMAEFDSSVDAPVFGGQEYLGGYSPVSFGGMEFGHETEVSFGEGRKERGAKKKKAKTDEEIAIEQARFAADEQRLKVDEARTAAMQADSQGGVKVTKSEQKAIAIQEAQLRMLQLIAEKLELQEKQKKINRPPNG